MNITSVEEILKRSGVSDKNEMSNFLKCGQLFEQNGFSVRFFECGSKNKSVGVEIWDNDSPTFTNIGIRFKTVKDMLSELEKINKKSVNDRMIEEIQTIDSFHPNVVYNSHGKTYIYHSALEFVSEEKIRCMNSIKKFDKVLQSLSKTKSVVDLTPEVKDEPKKLKR